MEPGPHGPVDVLLENTHPEDLVHELACNKFALLLAVSIPTQ